MSATMVLTGCVAYLVVAVACSSSKNNGAHLVGGLMFAAASLGFSAATALLIWVGVKNHWSSDGPGMLMIMIGVAFFGLGACVGWWITGTVLFGSRRGRPG